MTKTLLYIATFWLLLFVSLASFAPDRHGNLIEEVLIQTNQFRKSEGLTALIMRKELNAIAQKHSKDMASGRMPFGHKGFNKREAKARKQLGAKYSFRFAENVASGATSGEEVVEMWKKSPGHRRNMLGDYKFIGVGAATGKDGIIYFTQVFGG